MSVDLGGIDLIRQFGQGLVKKKVGIIEFAESDQFCNKPLYPRQRVLLKLIFLEELDGYEEDVLTEWIKSTDEGGEVRIAPKIRERMQMLRDRNYPHFTTIQLVEGRRSGKGYMTGAAIAKKVYDMVQLENPPAHYGIAEGENIYFSIVADSQDQAKKFQFKDARNWILDCRPLQDYVGEPLAESLPIFTPADLKRVDSLKDRRINAGKALASLRVEAFAKNARTIRGQAAIMWVFDEMAHITPGESHISDEELFTAAEPSLAQFKQDAIIFANSSPYQKIGKFYDLYEQSQALDSDLILYPTIFMMQSPSWEMYKDWEREAKWSGAVMVSPDWDSTVPGVLEERQKERANPEKYRVEYRSQFAEVMNAFLDPSKVDQMFDPVWSQTTIGKTLTTRRMGTIEYVYKAHGDPSTVGANFGFAIGHIEKVLETNEAGETVEAPHVVFDLIDAFYPEDFPDHTIDWLEILPVFTDYINHFRPYEFTFDQFNSAAPIQMLQSQAQKLGVWDTQIFMKPGTVPQNRKRAHNFKAALNLGRVHAPHPSQSIQGGRNSLELARNELKFLVEKAGRIEKQDLGPVQTKDMADCVMEVVDALIGESLMADSDFLNQHMELGAWSGYSLGNRTSGGEADPFANFYQNGPATVYNPARGIKRRNNRRW